MSTFDEQLERTLAQYHEQREELARLQVRLSEISATATAPRRVVTVTVGSRGEVTELTFPTGVYRNLTPNELSATILATITEARAQAERQQAELMAPMMPPGLSAEDLMSGKADLRSFLPEQPRMADVVFGDVPGAAQ